MRPRTLPRRADQQDPPGLRWARPAAVLHGHGRHPQRLHPGRSVHRQDPRHPARTGTPPRPPGAGGGRQGLLGPDLPRLPAQTRRPCGFDRTVYRRRNVVERCFNRLKQWRGIATRYDKQPDRYLAAITLASTLIWLQT
jgi:transposase